MLKTRTGGFPIGFRRGGTEWQKEIGALIQWAKANDLACIDLGKDADVAGKAGVHGRLRLRSGGPPPKQRLNPPHQATREAAVAENSRLIEKLAALGAINYFLVMLPEKPELPRAENFGYMVESFRQLAPVLEGSQARLVVEGWPGPCTFCCTP